MNKSSTMGALKSRPSQNRQLMKKLKGKLKQPKGFFAKKEQSSFQISNGT